MVVKRMIAYVVSPIAYLLGLLLECIGNGLWKYLPLHVDHVLWRIEEALFSASYDIEGWARIDFIWDHF